MLPWRLVPSLHTLGKTSGCGEAPLLRSPFRGTPRETFGARLLRLCFALGGLISRHGPLFPNPLRTLYYSVLYRFSPQKKPIPSVMSLRPFPVNRDRLPISTVVLLLHAFHPHLPCFSAYLMGLLKRHKSGAPPPAGLAQR